MDYEKIAQYGGYTKGSAQVMYRKALRKLLDAFPVPEESQKNTSDATPSTPKPKGGKAGAGSGAAKKRKADAGADANSTTISPDAPDAGAAPTTFVDGSGVDGEAGAASPVKTPAKRQRKSPVKKTPTYAYLSFFLRKRVSSNYYFF